MLNEHSNHDERERQLDAVIAAYYRAVEAGQCIDQKDFIAKHPEVQQELGEFFADLGIFNGANRQDQRDPALEPTIATVELNGKSLNGGERVRYFGAYEIMEELGAGGMGVVYKARHARLRKIVALKMIRTGAFASEHEVKMFEAEARAAAKLDHPGIVSVHEVGLHAGQHFFSMDYVAGDNLSKLHRNEPVPARRAAELVKQLAEAIHYAHGKGIVHRDLKPANILLTADGVPRITDFGLAKRLWADEDSIAISMTATGQILGTAGYMPPEQADGKTKQVGPSADIYSLGAVLYALLTSRAPFVGDTPSHTIMQVLQKEPLSPRKIEASIPRDLETICLKCLEKEPHKRYGTAHLLANDLQLFLEGKPVKARPVSSMERSWRWCRRNSVLTALLGLIVLVVLGLPIVVWSQVLTIVDGVQDARGAALPGLISELKLYPSFLVTSVLNTRFENEPEPHRKLNLAFALAAFGTGKSEYLVSQAGSVHEDDTRVLIEGLKVDRKASLELLQSGVLSSTREKNWRKKSQLAILTLYLGESASAIDMCQIEKRPDPVQRTVFIDEFPKWHTNTTAINELLRPSQNVGLCSAVMQAIASIPESQFSSDEKQVWKSLAEEWHAAKAEGVTHSSSELLLRRWNLPLPKSAAPATLMAEADWDVNTAGQTFLRIPAGSFLQRLPNQKIPRVVAFTEPFWMSDREVSVGQFQQFMSDPDYPASEKPTDWPGANQVLSPTPDHPVQRINWWDAILYCNWLSRREGLTPAYQLTTQTANLEGREFRIWTLLRDSGGYRLPLDAEWEYACRAGTTTKFSSGDDEDLLRAYSPSHARRPSVCGVHLPNAWGLFDMHGNVLEMVGYSHSTMLYRGGAYFYDAEHQHVQMAAKFGPFNRPDLCSFRLLRGRPSLSGTEPKDPAAMTLLVRPSPNLQSITSVQVMEFTDCCNSVQHSSDSQLAVYGGHNRGAGIMDLKDRKVIQEFPGHSMPVWTVAMSPDGRFAVTGCEDRTLRIFEVATGRELDRSTFDGIFSCVRFSKDGQTIVATNWDQTVRRLKLKNNRLSSRTEWPFAFAPLDIAFLPDEEHFVFGTAASTVLLCDAETGIIQKTFEGHKGWVHSVAVLNDGKQILSASHDSTIRLWNVETGKTERVYPGHSGKVNEIRLLPDGKYFLSCGEDMTVRLWDIASGRELARGVGKGEFRALSVAPDGKSCLTGGMPGTLLAWALPNAAELHVMSSSAYIPEMRSGDALQSDFSIKNELSLRATDVFISVDSSSDQPLFSIDWGPANGTDFIVHHDMLDEDLIREEASALQNGYKRAQVKTVTINGVNRHIGLWTKTYAPSP